MEMFKLFDVDGSGYINILDLEEVGLALGWKKEEGKIYRDG